MRRRICDADDEVAVDGFWEVLRRMGARIERNDWGMGVDIFRVKLGNEDLSVFSDSWLLHIEGSDDLVQSVFREFTPNAA